MNFKRKPTILIVAAVVLVVGGVAAFFLVQKPKYGNQQMAGMQSAVPPSDAVATTTVTIKDYKFQPAAITVAPGTTVTWTNKDSVQHTVTSSQGAPVAFGSELLKQDETFSYTFQKTGTYPYYCKPHPYMKGTVYVVPSRKQ